MTKFTQEMAEVALGMKFDGLSQEDTMALIRVAQKRWKAVEKLAKEQEIDPTATAEDDNA